MALDNAKSMIASILGFLGIFTSRKESRIKCLKLRYLTVLVLITTSLVLGKDSASWLKRQGSR